MFIHLFVHGFPRMIFTYSQSLMWIKLSRRELKDSLNQVCVNPGLLLTVLDQEALGY